MENIDSLRREDEVTVRIEGPEGNQLFENTSSGFHSLEEAVNATVEKAGLDISPEDCVFEITNRTTGVSHRYRLNAHGHLKLII